MRDPMGLGALDDWATGKTEAILLFQQVIINTSNIKTPPANLINRR